MCLQGRVVAKLLEEAFEEIIKLERNQMVAVPGNVQTGIESDEDLNWVGSH